MKFVILQFKIEYEESSFSTTDSDSGSPFNLVNKKHSSSGKRTISVGDASLISIKEAIDALDQSQFDHLLMRSS